jgi:serine/threonine protein kinase
MLHKVLAGQKNVKMSRKYFMRAFQNLFFAVREFLNKNLVHQDIKSSNVVVPPSDKLPRFIDIGMMSTFSNFYGDFNEMMGLAGDYSPNPPEYRVIHHLMNNRNVLLLNPRKYLDDYEFKNVESSKKIITGKVAEEFAVFLRAFNSSYNKAVVKGKHSTSNADKDLFAYVKRIGIHLKSDLYSLGIMLFGLEHHLLGTHRDNATDVNVYHRLIRGMIHPSPIHRLSINDALALVQILVQ